MAKTSTTTEKKTMARHRRHARVRSKVIGTADRPRLSVFKSNKGMYIQLIDDSTGTTIAAVSSLGMKGTKTEQATALGTAIAEAAKAKNITSIVFDRGGYMYIGRLQALADAARTAGLQF